ncbi:hypothetical protein L6452_36679 [Arctium lappa]|uniref:Uncharacterized protein n=1 Tax=Arctium lappa TaxID=4217 RepID=A0ACB8YA14_ARCLA|nr:hypothetical protein L6452_36679 [Arctium lappa]
MEFEPNRRKLEETVIGILKAADFEIASELSVRREAEKLLSVDLSDLASKRLVRRIIESFLLSSSPVDEFQEEPEGVEEVQTDKFPVDDRKIAGDDGGGRVICKLPGMRRVSIQKFRGTKLVSIREYYQKEGKVFPSGRGITLNSKQWSAFRSSFPDIEAAITKMEANIRGEGMEKKQTEAEASTPSTSLASEPCDLEKLQTEAEASNPSTSLASEPRVLEEFQIHPLIPIATTRFTGRNYYCWKRQMEFFLNQLKISYVLIESCPKIPVSPESSSEHISESKSRLITASGITIDENFHVSVIVSKLPPSWKHIRAKLMQEEYLPLDKLIYRLKDEEDYRNGGKNVDKFGQKKNESRVWCFGCGKEGHIRRNCPLTISYRWRRSQGSEQPREG